jgi:hypothetical protein
MFAFVGFAGGYWAGWYLGETFQRRFEPPDAPIPGWHVWIVAFLWFGSAIIGCIIGLGIYDLLFQHHRY